MNRAARLRRLEAAAPKCDGRVRRLADPGEDLGAPCPRCGDHHVVVVEEVVVEALAVPRPSAGGVAAGRTGPPP